MGRFFNWFGLPGKFVLTVLMSMFALALAVITARPERIICAFAMILSSLGDILLMNYRPVTDRLPFRGFVAGAAAFGIAHIIYASAFLYLIISNGYRFVNYGFFCGIALFAASVAALAVMLAKNRSGKKMTLLPFCYLLLIAFNCTVIFSCSASRGLFGLLSSVGALSFFVSDMFIAFDVVAGLKIRNSDTIIWWFYPIGQILLLAGA